MTIPNKNGEFQVPPSLFAFKRVDTTKGQIKSFNLIAYRGTTESNQEEFLAAKISGNLSNKQLNDIKGKYFKAEAQALPELHLRFRVMAAEDNRHHLPENSLIAGTIFKDCHNKKKMIFDNLMYSWSQRSDLFLPNYRGITGLIEGDEFFESQGSTNYGLSTLKMCREEDANCFACDFGQPIVITGSDNNNVESGSSICANYRGQPTWRLPYYENFRSDLPTVQTVCEVF